jgi:hypothetical protein
MGTNEPGHENCLHWKLSAQLISLTHPLPHSTWEYKPPSQKDIPIRFNVALLKGTKHSLVVPALVISPSFNRWPVQMRPTRWVCCGRRRRASRPIAWRVRSSLRSSTPWRALEPTQARRAISPSPPQPPCGPPNRLPASNRASSPGTQAQPSTHRAARHVIPTIPHTGEPSPAGRRCHYAAPPLHHSSDVANIPHNNNYSARRSKEQRT